MASDTAPAVPEAADTATQQPATGRLVGALGALMEPVDPARAEPLAGTDLAEHTDTDGGPKTSDGTSADYHLDLPDNDDSNGTGGKDGKAPQGVVRAWLLAGAERWRKGADARNKALDVQKAKATALQVKESRTLNRSEKFASPTGSGSGAGGGGANRQAKPDKSPSSKTGGGLGGSRTGSGGRAGGSGASKGNGSGSTGVGGGRGGSGASNGSARRGPSSGSGASGAGRGGSAGRSNGSGGGKPGGGRSGSGGGHKNSGFGKGDSKGLGKGNGGHRNGASGSGGSGAGGGAGKPAGGHKTPSGNRSGSGSDTNRKPPKKQSTATCGDASGISLTKDKKPKPAPDKNTGTNTGAGGAKKPGPGATTGKGSTGGGPASPAAPAKKDAPKPGKPTPGTDASSGKKTDLTKDPKGTGPAKDGKKAGPDSAGKKTSLEKKPRPEKPADPADPKTAKDPKAPKDAKGSTDPKTAKDAKGGKAKPAGPAPVPGGPHINTRTSRETGYRDGTRAARAVAHVEAWRDGVKDGWDDIKEAAARDKTRLDQAHTAYKNRPAPAVEESAVPVPATPIEVTGTDAKHVHLGAGAARSKVGRGEVRNFLTLIDRLETKTDTLTKISEETQGLAAEAEEQFAECQQLLEQAKAVEGGGKVIGTLNKLADTAKEQTVKAQEVHKRALRAAEACKTLLGNVRTRYEPVFQAVVDSPETRPAELNFYRDRGYSPAHAAA